MSTDKLKDIFAVNYKVNENHWLIYLWKLIFQTLIISVF